MRNRIGAVAILVVMVGAIAGFARGYVVGAAVAVVQTTHGRSRFLYLGCSYSPRNRYEERRDVLLREKYHLSYGVIGGIGPTTYHEQYQFANNLATWALLRIRYGPRFLEKVEDQARKESLLTLRGQSDGEPSK